jgi:hypothetical protein
MLASLRTTAGVDCVGDYEHDDVAMQVGWRGPGLLRCAVLRYALLVCSVVARQMGGGGCCSVRVCSWPCARWCRIAGMASCMGAPVQCLCLWQTAPSARAGARAPVGGAQRTAGCHSLAAQCPGKWQRLAGCGAIPAAAMQACCMLPCCACPRTIYHGLLHGLPTTGRVRAANACRVCSSAAPGSRLL